MVNRNRYLVQERLHHLLWSAVDWVFPPACIGCGVSGISLCPDCAAKILRIREPRCPFCSTPLSSAGICPGCKGKTFPYLELRAFSVYSGLAREAIHQLKYKRNIGLAEEMARQMFPMIAVAGWQFDLVIPVPLAEAKKRLRGYNQTELLARPIALHFCRPLSTTAMSRLRETQSQVDLKVDERRKNVAGAFTADPEEIYRRKVLLIDDVSTTGATLRSAAQALKEAGAAEVYAATYTKSLWKAYSDK